MEERFYVGGQIYYIDPEDNGAIYHFYDSLGLEIPDINVGNRPYQYSIEGNPSKDKYYVFCSEPMGYWKWSGSGNLLGTKADFGAGRENTELIECNSGSLTLKTGIMLMNCAEVNGCSDWFIPSKEELDELTCSGLVNDIFGNGWIWSSSEYSAQYAWSLRCSSKVWYRSDKGNNIYGALVGVRAF